jgi:hypothetical protein
MTQLCDLLGLNAGFIGAKAANMLGRRYDNKSQENAIKKYRQGSLNAAVVSVKSGKSGVNLQGMNWMVSLGYIGRATEEDQAKGITPHKEKSNTQDAVVDLDRRNRQGFT